MMAGKLEPDEGSGELQDFVTLERLCTVQRTAVTVTAFGVKVGYSDTFSSPQGCHLGLAGPLRSLDSS